MLPRLGMLARIGARNVLAHRVKSLVVGAILFFGTALVVAGSALLDSVRTSMEKSVTSSLAGHVQVYSADAKDDLALFGGGLMGTMDIDEIDEFAAVRPALEALPHVRRVVPMGITTASSFTTPALDRLIAQLRAAVRRGDVAAQDVVAEHIRQLGQGLKRDLGGQAALADDPQRAVQGVADLDAVIQPSFWADFHTDPEPVLEALDTRVAPLAADSRLLYMRLIGTDLDLFARSFDRFRVVDGAPVPPGRRGLLMSRRYYEKQVKNKVARELDAVAEAIADGKQIAADPLLQERIARNAQQFRSIVYEVPPAEVPALEAELRAALPGVEGELPALLEAFLRVDDAVFANRYAQFYEIIAPRIALYEFAVGDVVTLRSFTRSGYVRAVNLRFYGTFEFAGLERSDLAAANNFVDLISFRSLYGRMSAEQQDELAAIRAAAGVRAVSRDDAEAALFGAPAPDPEPAAASPPVEIAPAAAAAEGDALPLDDREYSPEEMDGGMALNAAIILDDSRYVEETIASVEGLGLGLQARGWQDASGLVGQIIVVLQAVIYVAILVIFLVALVIINNTMVTATMERTAEIGTMRAIGAGRAWVVLLFLVETLVLGLGAGSAGAAGGVLLVILLGQVGIPAAADIMVLLFAGPRLYPEVGGDDVAFGLAVILAISLLSTLYPALLAARVRPVVAMTAKE